MQRILVSGLCLSFALSVAAAGQEPIPVAAPRSVHIDIAPNMGLRADSETLVRAKPGASFVKIHFAEFKIPAGAVLEISDESGKQVYRYSAAKLGPHTVESKLGENGKNRFAAMSIHGEVAKVKLILNGAKWHWGEHDIRIRQVMEGFSREKLATLINENVDPLSVCGTDQRKDAVCYAESNPVEYNRSRPVARLLMSGGLCTAWRVGDSNHMMTNNHCIDSQSDTQASEVWFNYQYSTCGGKTLAPISKVTAAQMLKTDGPLDYTLFTINDVASVASFGHFGLDPRDALKGEQIFIPQHGGGNPKQLAITSDSNGGGICQVDETDRSGTGSGNTDIGYKCDTTGGASGSPVLASSSRKVLALHHLGGCPSGTNSGAQIKRIWPQIASFFNNVIPVGDDGKLPPTPIALNPNEAKLNLAGDLGSETMYALDLANAPSSLKFVSSGGSGDVDLYVKYGSQPSTTSSDCKSETVGNAESCSISNPQAGRYYVMLRANQAYAGTSLLAQVANTGRGYENNSPYAIPDNNSTGISSPITVDRSGASNSVKVDVNITHPYIGDLVVDLVAPNGKIFNLHNRSGGSADNIVKAYTVNVGTVDSLGVWKLKVADRARADAGKINSWKLSFN